MLPIDSSVDFVEINTKDFTRTCWTVLIFGHTADKAYFVNAINLETVSHSLLKISIQGC
jgi:hypothetical protein